MDRKKQLKEQYKQMKPEMGLFIIRSKIDNYYYIEGTQNLKGKINSTKFKLNSGFHPDNELLTKWKENGSDNFDIEILEVLEYDKDETKTDYSEELAIMQMVWEEKLKQ